MFKNFQNKFKTGGAKFKGELKSKTVFSEMALKITLSSGLTAEIFNHYQLTRN